MIIVPSARGIIKRSTTNDPFFSSTVFLWNGAGSNGGTTITNIAASGIASLSAVGGASLSTTQIKFGSVSAFLAGTSLRFDNGGTQSSSFAYGTAPFTIEFWLYLSSIGTLNVLDQRTGASSSVPTFFETNGTNTASYFAGGSTRITAGTLSTSVWKYWAYSKQNGSATGELSLDGTVIGSWTDTLTYGNAPLILGGLAGTSCNGYFGPVRITKGVARYSGNFSVPTAAFPES